MLVPLSVEGGTGAESTATEENTMPTKKRTSKPANSTTALAHVANETPAPDTHTCADPASLIREELTLLYTAFLELQDAAPYIRDADKPGFDAAAVEVRHRIHQIFELTCDMLRDQEGYAEALAAAAKKARKSVFGTI